MSVKKFIGAADLSFDANGKLETASGLTNENALGEIPVTSGLVGNSRPDVLYWASGTDSYAAAATGAITAVRRRALVYNNGNACLLSIADTGGAEIPYLIPDEFVREIVFPFTIAIGAAIKIKNLETGVNAGKLWIEFA